MSAAATRFVVVWLHQLMRIIVLDVPGENNSNLTLACA